MGRNSEINRKTKIREKRLNLRKLSVTAAAVIILAAAAAAAALMMTKNIWNRAVLSYDMKVQSEAYAKPAEHIILSMGEKPGRVYISWKGSGSGNELMRIARRENDLQSSEIITAEKSVLFGGAYVRCSISLDGIEPGVRYYYDMGDESSFGTSGNFVINEDSGNVKFLYLGDIQFEKSIREYEKWGRMVSRIYEEEPDLDFAVIGGDMVNETSEISEWEAFLDNCSVFSSLPLMTVPGNHEGKKSNNIYRKMFAAPDNGPADYEKKQTGSFYFFDYGRCRFLMTDSSFLTKERMQNMGEASWEAAESSVEQWMSDSLSESRKSWNVAVIHHPVYGMHDNETVSPELRKRWEPILSEEGTDMVLSGHQHLYMRTKAIRGTVYIMGNSGRKTSGFFNGFNAPVYSRKIYASGPNYQIITATPSKLKVTSYNENGLIIDETIVNKGLGFHILEFFRRNQIIV